MSHSPNGLNRSKQKTTTRQQRPWWKTALKWVFGGFAVAAIFGSLLLALGLMLIFPKLPDVSALQDYRPKLPLRVYAKGGELIGEFGEEKRRLVRFQDIPEVVKQAVLATEDTRFYEHGGVDSVGLARAFVANLSDFKSQGASTITMQVARNVYLNAEKTLKRKLYELILTYKLESALSKDQIFEIYLNQIYMGNRSYGFGAASEAYFGKPLAQITLPEAALLAGLPKAPSTYNPLRNYNRAKQRQEHVLTRMQTLEFITPEQAQAAKAIKLKLENKASDTALVAQYPAETVRQMIYSQYGEETYTRGLNVYTSIDYEKQKAAYHSVRSALLAYESSLPYRGPEQYINLPKDAEQLQDALATVFSNIKDTDDIRAAVVLQANTKRIEVELSSGERVKITQKGLKQIKTALTSKAPVGKRIVPGAVIRVYKQANKQWSVVQLPDAQAALVALSPLDGAIEAMIGGFDFGLHQFNRATQAWRQPGSSLKPFVYSGALEWGMGPATIVNDAPVSFTDSSTGEVWEPKNYDGKFDGPMKLREGLARSKNMVSIRILEKLGPKQAQKWLGNFGFEAERHPPYLTMALGAGSVTPLQMATAYAVFANGGLRVQPWLIRKIVSFNGIVLQSSNHPVASEAQRVIPKRNAFIIDTMLQDVTSIGGTAARAQRELDRDDVYGKTGTTNNTLDAWFVGFQPSITAAVWVGYDNPHSLGRSATGGGIALPIWLDFMQVALKETPRQIITPPSGVTLGADGEWYYKEYADGSGVRSIGLEPIVGPLLVDDILAPPFTLQPNAPQKVTREEKKQLLDLFKLE